MSTPSDLLLTIPNDIGPEDILLPDDEENRRKYIQAKIPVYMEIFKALDAAIQVQKARRNNWPLMFKLRTAIDKSVGRSLSDGLFLTFCLAVPGFFLYEYKVRNLYPQLIVDVPDNSEAIVSEYKRNAVDSP